MLLLRAKRALHWKKRYRLETIVASEASLEYHQKILFYNKILSRSKTGAVARNTPVSLLLQRLVSARRFLTCVSDKSGALAQNTPVSLLLLFIFT